MIPILLYQNIKSDFIVAVVLCKRYRICVINNEYCSKKYTGSLIPIKVLTQATCEYYLDQR